MLFVECTYGEEPAYTIPETIKDIRDVTFEDVEGFDAIMYLAGLSNDPLGDLNRELTYEINHRASVRLAQWLKRSVWNDSYSHHRAAIMARLAKDLSTKALPSTL